MDLFIINRYVETDKLEEDHEAAQLQKLKDKIEQRKKNHLSQKQSIAIIEEPIVEDKSLHIKEEIILKEQDTSSNIINETHLKVTKSDKLSEFQVLGIKDFEKKTQVKRILPYWLSHPIHISTDLKHLSSDVESISWLHSNLKNTLISEGVTSLFPVQKEVIPFVIKQHNQSLLWPHDICVSAPTGSGKTLAFVLPIIQVLMNDVGRHIRALIVLPVQELATQVAKVFKKYVCRTRLKTALLSGAVPLKQEQEQIVRYTESSGWVSEVDIIVCTAGRLVEHLQNTPGFSLKNLKFLVIDEADRIMDHIQNDWLYHLDRHIKLENQLMSGKVSSLSWNTISEQKPPPHKLLFSATLSQDPEKLDQWGLFQPKLFSSAPMNNYEDENIRKYATPAELKEHFVTCDSEDKPLVLFHFLAEQKWDKVLCFANSAESAHRLTVLLNIWGEGQIKASELSSALDRSARDNVLKKFTQSEINVLVGTDALARGIDIPLCDYVVSYDPPRNIKTYIHRVGRTGRAGRKGLAVTILQPNQVNLFKELIISGGKAELPQMKIDTSTMEKLTEGYRKSMQAAKLQIDNEINTKVQKSKALKRGKVKTLKRKGEKLDHVKGKLLRKNNQTVI